MGKGVLYCIEGEFHRLLWQLPQRLCLDGGCLIRKLTREVALNCACSAVLQMPAVISGCNPLLHTIDKLTMGYPRVILHDLHHFLVKFEDCFDGFRDCLPPGNEMYQGVLRAHLRGCRVTPRLLVDAAEG